MADCNKCIHLPVCGKLIYCSVNGKVDCYHYLETKQSTSEENKRWIPVSERLPDKPEKYLVTGRSFRDKLPQIWICECMSVGLTIGWINNVKNPIIEAWMPLPEPPKEEKWLTEKS